MSIATLDTVEDASFEVVSGTALQSVVHAETDVQIATAKRYPRSVSAFKQMAMDMATLDEDTAASCFYSMPRGGKKIEGESVRLAEIAASAWGNIQAGARIIDDDGKMVTAQGFAWDLQRNYRVSFEVQRRVTGKDGKRFSDDMVIVTCNAAAAIAFRNAIFKVIPKAYIRPVYLAARKVAIGDAKTLVAKRDECIAYFKKMGIDADKVTAAVEKKSIEDIGLDELATLKGMATAIKDGELSIEEAFPDAVKEKKATAVLDSLKENGNGSKHEPAKIASQAPIEQPKPATAGVSSEATMLQLEDFIRDNAIPQAKVQDEVKNVGAKKFSALTEAQACAMQANLERFVNSPSGD